MFPKSVFSLECGVRADLGTRKRKALVPYSSEKMLFGNILSVKLHLNVKFSKGPSASHVHKSEDIEKSMGRIKKPCIFF